MSTAF
jgi:hypothetical protein